MANPKQVKRLKQGVKQWNEWREQLPETQPELGGAHLGGANLKGANLKGATLPNVNLSNANLKGANLSNANLDGADLDGANLREADLRNAYLRRANLSHAVTLETIFVNVDLSKTKGLAEIEHRGPSIVQLHTVQLPQDGSALHFLRGVSVPDAWIDF